MLGTVITTTAATVVAAPAAGLLGRRGLMRARNARLIRIADPRGIDERYLAPIGGIDQWLSIRGDDVNNPVLLELHGGPGSVNSIFTARTRAWEKHFTLVRWDMRGAGKTLRHGGAEGQGEVSFERLHRDALEVIHHVRTRLGVQRVVLLGHSFGSVFGLRIARSHPELLSAYVGTDQNILDAGRDNSDNSAYFGVIERLRKAGKKKELATVEAMGPDARSWTAEQHSRYNRYAAATDPQTFGALKSVVMKSLWYSPLHSLRDLGTFFRGMKLSEQVVRSITGFDDWADGTRFEVPFFLFQGAQDMLTPPERARRFFDDVHAPVKDFALIDDAGHFAAFKHPDRFLDLLLTRVRPALDPVGAL
ncbi:alpha/beta fold hydrolase [Streptomyces olivoreticuli]|uniref:alpha/beta fold hydrolase n=1 Tax=Streptomyces olivoreticuli TaxID=68246 RepID=UPI000E241169|nr:alpha/beta hydrolase [Streptomyces olivoreticuli]